jgi:FAD/FMN-containing dehydrogenase
MNLKNLKIAGDTLTDRESLERFSKDASAYKIVPKIVIEPQAEADIQKVIVFARNEGLNITCRAGGSGLSGAGIGRGIILNFKKHMNRVLAVGDETIVQPGAILDDFLAQMSDRNLMLPSVPSSSAWCALGGNVGTRSTGPRTARYGTIDPFVTSLKFITARSEVVDTRLPLPAYLTEGLKRIRDQLLADTQSQTIIARRPFIAGGYNLKALTDYSDARDMATHLLVGSVGTLAVVTEIRLRLMKKKFSRGTYAALFKNSKELADAVNRLKALEPSAMEFVDDYSMHRVQGKILNTKDLQTEGALLVEFDESEEQARQGKHILQDSDISHFWDIEPGSKQESWLWEDRKRILPSLWVYARENKWILPSIIDDIAIHLKDFARATLELRELMRTLDHDMALFGHIGFGSIHARPFFEPKKGDVIQQIMTVSRETFQLLQKFNGTLVGEHNAGRSRSVYLEKELGQAYAYLREIKDLFDPDDILNPGTVFNTAPITEGMDLSL